MKLPVEKEMLSIRIPKQLNKEFTEYTNGIGISKNGLILLLIKRELEMYSQQGKQRNLDGVPLKGE